MKTAPDIRRAATRRALALLAAMAVAAALVPACGGGSGEGGVDTGGTGIRTLAVGPISGFGSIVVAGVHYDDSQAQRIDDDGNALPADALGLGAVVSIDAGSVTTTATRQEAQARVVRSTPVVLGPVEAIDATAGTLRVLGQAVATGPGTVYAPALAGGLGALRVGQVVAVHGLLDPAQARVVATRIEPRDGAGAYRVTGTVTSLDRNALRLGLGALVVDLAAVAPLPDGLGLGATVRLVLRTTPVSGVWTAQTLRLPGQPLPDRERVEIEGRITAFESAQRFSVAGVPVDATAATRSGTLALGVRVEVEGRTRDGLLVATRVAVDAEDGGGSEAIELEGSIGATNPAARSFTLRGLTVLWTDATRFESSRASDIADGRRASVKGRLGPDGSRVEATVIHVER